MRTYQSIIGKAVFALIFIIFTFIMMSIINATHDLPDKIKTKTDSILKDSVKRDK
jgi:4-hydroxybenzoate polyprenyltransferase